MKNTNIGIASFVICNKIRDSFFEKNKINESQTIASDFLDVVKKSPLLQLEFNVFNNLKNKYIDNDIIATRYIDNNIKLFETYTIDEIDFERQKISKFINENEIPEDNYDIILYKSIDKLIRESLKSPNDIDVDGIHESFVFVLEHLKKPQNKKIELIDNTTDNEVNDVVIEIAINKFNEKYSTLSDDEKTLLKTLFESDNNKKQQLLEDYKKETKILLEQINSDDLKSNVTLAIEKINNMNFDANTVDDNIISLFELKKKLQ